MPTPTWRMNFRGGERDNYSSRVPTLQEQLAADKQSSRSNNPQHLHTLVVRIMEILSVKTTISTSVGAQSVPSYLRPVGPSDMLPRFILVKIISLGLLTNFGRFIYTWPVSQLVNLSAWIWQWVRCEPSCTWLRSLSFGTNVTCTFGGWCMKDMLIYPRPQNCTSWRGGRGINKTQTMKQVKRLKDQIGFDTLIF